jgi:hypothetical protein
MDMPLMGKIFEQDSRIILEKSFIDILGRLSNVQRQESDEEKSDLSHRKIVTQMMRKFKARLLLSMLIENNDLG